MVDKKHAAVQSSTPGAGARPLHSAIRRQLDEAVERAVASARAAYQFNPGSYTAQVITDLQAVRERLRWVADLDDGVSR